MGYCNGSMSYQIAPFPPPPISPLRSQPSSPSRSRATSPHKYYRKTTQQSSSIGLSLDLPAFSNANSNSEINSKEDDVNHIADDKLRESSSFTSSRNGIRLPTYTKISSQQYLIEQIKVLNFEGENSLHCSSSGSSSDNSLNQSPANTPSTTPAIPHQGPGRGDNKSRLNGESQILSSVPVLCDTSTPPPPLNSCSVPYPSYPHPVAIAAIPTTRSVYPYTHSYRMPFNPNFNYQPSEMYPINNCSYVPYIFSSTQSQVPHRNSHCFNCGAAGHNGANCKGQTIEDITQKKTYKLDYSSTLPDADK